MTSRHPKPLNFSQAIDASPSLAKLSAMARESSEMLKSVQRLLPMALRLQVKAGPLEDEAWCLLVSSNAAAAKVRQILPTLQAELQSGGRNLTSIRIKVLSDSLRNR